MKEVTYEDWLKNPTPRVMWVWDKDEKDKIQRKELYNIPGQEVLHGCSRISAVSCGTLMGIKKACRKLYRIAQKLTNVNSLVIDFNR